MAEATLDSPHTLDPRQATKLRVRSTKVDHVARAVHVVIDYVDSSGAIIKSEDGKLTGPQVETWIANQETTLLNRFMAVKALTGTVA